MDALMVSASPPQALKMGGRLFASNCSVCHGSDAKGAYGFPNLTDSTWRWGGDADTIKATIMGGRIAVMPAWGPVLGEDGVKNVAAYVRHDLAGLPLPQSTTVDLNAGKHAFARLNNTANGVFNACPKLPTALRERFKLSSVWINK